MREHPDWTLISHIDDHCGREEPGSRNGFLLSSPSLPPIVALVVFSAAVVVGRFPSTRALRSST